MSFSSRKAKAKADHASCSGCGLCQLVCPVWHQKRDVRLTPLGRAKALQNQANIPVLAASIDGCTLCGACEPVCPEEIPLVDMILQLRTSQPLQRDVVLARLATAPESKGIPPAATLLLAGSALGADDARLNRVLSLLGATRARDEGADIALALEAGVPIPGQRLKRFLETLREAKQSIVAEGLLLRDLRRRLPRKKIVGLGEALSKLESIRGKLRASDLYVIEPRAFHGDYQRLIGHYDALRAAFGGAMNLDLQRIAISTTASAAQHALGAPAISIAEQVRWILEGRSFERVVVEDVNDCAAFAAATDRPVLHLADL